jgi:hypothetical protein
MMNKQQLEQRLGELQSQHNTCVMQATLLETRIENTKQYLENVKQRENEETEKVSQILTNLDTLLLKNPVKIILGIEVLYGYEIARQNDGSLVAIQYIPGQLNLELFPCESIQYLPMR